MKRIMIVLVSMALLTMGCDKSFWQKPTEPPAPAEPTREEILAKVKPLAVPFKQLLNAPQPGDQIPLPEETRNQVINGLRDAQLQYGKYAQGQEVLKEVGNEFAEMAKRARDQEQWPLVEACIDAFELLNLHSEVLSRLDDRAKLMIAKPKVEVKGFLEDRETKAINIFVQTTDRSTGKIKTTTRREGEEFDDMRIVRIIGNNYAVEFEYLKIPGLTFQVKGPTFQ